MRAVDGMYIVSVALFVTGLGLVVTGARSPRSRPAASEAAAVPVPVASVKQIMKGIVDPAAATVFNAVGSTVTAAGIEERAPKTDAEWEALGNSAAALIESGNLLLMGSRAVDQGEWVKMSRAMIESGQVVLKAVAAKDPDGVLAAGEGVNISCDTCHRTYQRGL